MAQNRVLGGHRALHPFRSPTHQASSSPQFLTSGITESDAIASRGVKLGACQRGRSPAAQTRDRSTPRSQPVRDHRSKLPMFLFFDNSLCSAALLSALARFHAVFDSPLLLPAALNRSFIRFRCLATTRMSAGGSLVLSREPLRKGPFLHLRNRDISIGTHCKSKVCDGLLTLTSSVGTYTHTFSPSHLCLDA